MAGENIKLVHETIYTLQKILNKNDRLCLIGFNDNIIFNSGFVNNNNQCISMIYQLFSHYKPKFGTNIGIGCL